MTRKLTLSVLALVLVATACGASTGASGGVASIDGTSAPALVPAADGVVATSNEEALLAFTQCLRDNGVEIADPTVDADGNVRLTRPEGGGGGGQGDPEAGSAFEACERHLEGVTIGFRDQDRTELEDSLLEFAGCMRANGYDMPDPDFTNFGPGAGPGGGPFGEIDQDDPEFQSAQAACEDILAEFQRRPGGAGSGAGGDNGS